MKFVPFKWRVGGGKIGGPGSPICFFVSQTFFATQKFLFTTLDFSLKFIFGLIKLLFNFFLGMLLVGFLFRNLKFVPYHKDISQKTASSLRFCINYILPVFFSSLSLSLDRDKFTLICNAEIILIVRNTCGTFFQFLFQIFQCK